MKLSEQTKLVLAASASAAAAGAFAALCLTVFEDMSDRRFLHRKQREKREAQAHDEMRQQIRQEASSELTLTSENGEKLKALYIKPSSPSKTAVLLSHGHKSSSTGDIAIFVDFYRAKGYHVFLVDHRASGDSEGTFVSFGYFEERDIVKWTYKIKAIVGDDCNILLHGVSMGSAAVMMAAADPDLPSNVKMAVADCGYTSAYEQLRYVFREHHVIEEPAVSVVNEMTKKIVGYDLKDASPIDAVAHTSLPILFIHGDSDDYVPAYMVQQLYDACTSKVKDLVIIPGAGHVESYVKNRDLYEKKVNEFIEKTIK